MPAPGLTVPAPGLAAPSALSYATPQALYFLGEAIAHNTAQVTGGAAADFSVSPALPAGLSLDPASGLLSGTPTALQRQREHTVTARNAAGSAQATLRLTVTGRGSWTATAPHAVPRHYGGMVSLSDGSVLVAGGFAAGGETDSALLYQPAADSWRSVSSLLERRASLGMVRLSDGRVLAFGGEQPGSITADSAELYGPGTESWTATGGMAVARSNATATLLPDGRVLAVGGYSRTGGLTFTNTVERYDPATGLWTTLSAPLSAARAQHTAQLLPGGTHLLVVGGVNSTGFLRSAELYAVDGSGSTPIAFSGTGNIFYSVQLDDGSVLVVCDGSTTAWRYRPDSGDWQTSSFSTTRSMPTLTRLADGRVLMAGGTGGGGARLSSAEIYNPDHNLWTAARPMADRRNAAVATLLGNGEVLVFSGFDGAAEVAGSERYRP